MLYQELADGSRVEERVTLPPKPVCAHPGWVAKVFTITEHCYKAYSEKLVRFGSQRCPLPLSRQMAWLIVVLLCYHYCYLFEG